MGRKKNKEIFARILAGKKKWTVRRGDSLEVLKALPPNSIDSIVTDPPYALSMMGAKWDTFKGEDGETSNQAFQRWCEEWARECLRVLKPGGHMLAFGGTRTFHRLVSGIEDAGFEIRDTIHWHYASGFPKSRNISKDIDKISGAKREAVGKKKAPGFAKANVKHGAQKRSKTEFVEYSKESVTKDAKKWEGWGTALKPAQEPICVARKPLSGTVAQNVLAHGVGALNIDGCRLSPLSPEEVARSGRSTGGYSGGLGPVSWKEENKKHPGRWPANLVFSHTEECEVVSSSKINGGKRGGYQGGKRKGGFFSIGSDKGDSKPNGRVYGEETIELWSCHPLCPVRLLDEQTGVLKSGLMKKGTRRSAGGGYRGGFPGEATSTDTYGDAGGASRFFYSAKVSTRERNVGCGDLFWSADGKLITEKKWNKLPKDKRDRGNVHPTLKPVSLMRWLCRLVTPPGGVVLDLFCGSGSTGMAARLEGFRFIGVDLVEQHVIISRHRIRAREDAVYGKPHPLLSSSREIKGGGDEKPRRREKKPRRERKKEERMFA